MVKFLDVIFFSNLMEFRCLQGIEAQLGVNFKKFALLKKFGGVIFILDRS